MSVLIDTSVLIVAAALGGLEEPERWSVSVITVGELHAGVLIAQDGAQQMTRLRRLAAVLAEAPVIEIDRSVAARYGELRVTTGRLPSNDLWIAATALAHDLTLVTADRQQAALPLVRSRLVDATI